MPAIDFNVRVPDRDSLDSFADMASTLGFRGIVVPIKGELPGGFEINNVTIYPRLDIKSTKLGVLKRELDKSRKKYSIIAVPLSEIDIANWAAKEARVDVLTFQPTKTHHNLRGSTARLAAKAGTSFEVSIAPLLNVTGLTRSKLIKEYRESITTACNAGMKVILSSGASTPIQMRSPWALNHIGTLFGLDTQYTEDSISNHTHTLLHANVRKLGDNHIAAGIELVSRGGDE